MGFVSRFIQGKLENAFDRWQTEEMQKRHEEQDKKVSKVVGMAQGLFDIGPIASVMSGGAWGVAGRQQVKQDINFYLSKTFEPILAEYYAFEGTLENLFGQWVYDNRVGQAIGETIGAAGGFVLGLYLGNPVLWSNVFAWLGGWTGLFVESWAESSDYEHPDVPGYPGTPTITDDLPTHAQDYIDNMVATPEPTTPTPTPRERYISKKMEQFHYI